jgi:hypothetical protein
MHFSSAAYMWVGERISSSFASQLHSCLSAMCGASCPRRAYVTTRNSLQLQRRGNRRLRLLMENAAGKGWLLAVQMLRRLVPHFPWSHRACIDAARGGHLEVLQWLRRPGKPEGVCLWNQLRCFSRAHGVTKQWIATQPN